jgi:hypothetical protein
MAEGFLGGVLGGEDEDKAGASKVGPDGFAAAVAANLANQNPGEGRFMSLVPEGRLAVTVGHKRSTRLGAGLSAKLPFLDAEVLTGLADVGSQCRISPRMAERASTAVHTGPSP